MTLKDKIVIDRNASIKNGVALEKTLLGTLIGELDRKSKTPNDEETIAIVKKMVESCKQCGAEDEAEILSRYLPTMLTEVELQTIISDYSSHNSLVHKKDMGKIMAHLKETYPGKYDGKLASQIVSKILC